MSIEIKVPTLGESITEATVSKWLKKEGEKFDIDEPLVEIETDKITLEVSAPSAGILEKINVDEGTNVNVGGVLGLINESNVSNIKNSSNIIPGHGGFFDRIDSFLLSIFVLYFFSIFK